VNDEWMDVIFIDYDGWQERNRCMSGSILLVEVDTVFNGAPYEARYWAYSNEAVFGSVFAAYPVEEAEQLEEMAAHFFPDSAVCAQG